MLALTWPGIVHVLQHEASGVVPILLTALQYFILSNKLRAAKRQFSHSCICFLILLSLFPAWQRSASERRKARRKVNQRFLTAMMDMGIPNEKAELALSETGNVGVEVATEWLFSVPDHVLEKHLASEPNTPVEAAAQNPEDHRVMLPRRVPLQVSNHLCWSASCHLIFCLYSPWLLCLSLPPVSFISWWCLA